MRAVAREKKAQTFNSIHGLIETDPFGVVVKVNGQPVTDEQSKHIGTSFGAAFTLEQDKAELPPKKVAKTPAVETEDEGSEETSEDDSDEAPVKSKRMAKKAKKSKK